MRWLGWLAKAPSQLTSRESHWFGVAATANGVGIGGTVAGLLTSSLPCVLAGGVIWLVGWLVLSGLLLVAATREARQRQFELEKRRRELNARHEVRLAELAELRRRLERDDEWEGRNR